MPRGARVQSESGIEKTGGRITRLPSFGILDGLQTVQSIAFLGLLLRFCFDRHTANVAVGYLI